jgi:acetyltransferase AlgX (SGNH hydrolase-like protein)
MSQPATAVVAPSVSRPRRRRLRWLARTAMVVGGLFIGLVVAEIIFYMRDDGAFPHLNVYTPDPELGVRLEPGATEKVAFGGNPLSHVRINSEGYRGDDWPAPATNEVLVVGDSQVFGLGVEEDVTFSAKLAEALKRPVINAGVPTYGPGEYRAVIAEQIAKRHPKTVVLTLNLVNDLFEVNHANKDRHAVWDGWAVRKESAPESTTWFPGRNFLYRKSHLFFALRKWRHSDDPIDERGFASEGTWKDAVSTGQQVAEQRHSLDVQRKKHIDDLTNVQHRISDEEKLLDEKIVSVLSEQEGADYATIQHAQSNPGDIVEDIPLAEGSRSIRVTADQIAQAGVVRQRLRKQLAEWAKSHKGTDAEQTRNAFADRDKDLAELATLDAKKLEAVLDPPLGAHIRDVKQLVEKNGARLVVAILPIDVQVSKDEWAKYGAQPIDMEPSKALTTELVELCKGLGVSVLDTTPVLAAAEPGAFLDKDIHMTPKGHAAVAVALAKTITDPPPAPPPDLGAHSPIPVPEAYKQASEIIVAGSSDAACETKQIREWLRIVCPHTEEARPLDIAIEKDDTHQAMPLVMPNQLSLLAPVEPGKELVAKITWSDKIRVLHLTWAAGATKPTIAFDKPTKNPKPSEPFEAPDFRSATERAICDCWQQVFGGERYSNGKGDHFTCSNAYGAADPACVKTYYGPKDRCPQLLACTRRDPASPAK